MPVWSFGWAVVTDGFADAMNGVACATKGLVCAIIDAEAAAKGLGDAIADARAITKDAIANVYEHISCWLV